MRMEKLMRDNGKMTLSMDLVRMFTKMGTYLKVIIKKESDMAKRS